jgi:ATP-binding cassette subfamily F protein uup
LKKLEKQIQKLEEDKKKITEQFNDGSLASEKIVELSQTLKKIQAELEEKEMLWLELSE